MWYPGGGVKRNRYYQASCPLGVAGVLVATMNNLVYHLVPLNREFGFDQFIAVVTSLKTLN